MNGSKGAKEKKTDQKWKKLWEILQRYHWTRDGSCGKMGWPIQAEPVSNGTKSRRAVLWERNEEFEKVRKSEFVP